MSGEVRAAPSPHRQENRTRGTAALGAKFALKTGFPRARPDQGCHVLFLLSSSPRHGSLFLLSPYCVRPSPESQAANPPAHLSRAAGVRLATSQDNGRPFRELACSPSSTSLERESAQGMRRAGRRRWAAARPGSPLTDCPAVSGPAHPQGFYRDHHRAHPELTTEKRCWTP